MRSLVAALALFLGACGFTPAGDAIRQGMAVKGAQAADEVLENSVWVTCQAATVGSVKRKFGVSRERAAAYNRFCPDTSAAEIISGPVE